MRYNICDLAIGGCPINNNFNTRVEAEVNRFAPPGNYTMTMKALDNDGIDLCCVRFYMVIV
jgi:hypothetical protein